MSHEYYVFFQLIKQKLSREGSIALFLYGQLKEIISACLINPFNSAVTILYLMGSEKSTSQFIIMFRMIWLAIQIILTSIYLLAAIVFQVWLWRSPEIPGSWSDKLIRRLMIREIEQALSDLVVSSSSTSAAGSTTTSSIYIPLQQ
jgi:hypothetical protein